MNPARLPLALVLGFLVFSSSKTMAKSLVETSGSCTSQGSWTTRALRQSEAIAKTAQFLRDDPDCKVLSEALQKVDYSDFYKPGDSSRDTGPGAKFETLPQDLNALRTVLLQNQSNNALSSRLTPVLAKAAIDFSTNSVSLLGPLSATELAGMKERINRTLGAGESLLSTLFTTAPQSLTCLQKSKNVDAGINLISASLQMMAAFASAQDGKNKNFATLMAQFNIFLRDMKYAGILSKLDVTRFWSEMSCLIETTQQQYCNTKDGLKLLEYQAQEIQITADLRKGLAEGKVKKDSAVEGYLLLNREVPAISLWLQKVQFGIEAKTANDAAFKNDTITAVNSLLADINRIQGEFNENQLIYKNLNDIELKQQNIRDLISRLTDVMTNNNSKINFFTKAKPGDLIPFYLIGRNEIPDEVLGKNGNMAISPNRYLLDVKRAPEFINPDALMAKILERLTALSDIALREGSKYFADRMSVDHLNLIDDAFTDPTVNVFEAFKNIRSYVAKLVDKFSKGKDQDQGIALSMVDTLGRIDRVLKNFSTLFAVAHSFHTGEKQPQGLNFGGLDGLNENQTAEIRSAYKNLVVSVYDEFNILLQKESFVTQRLTTYVKYDLFNRVQQHEDMSPYVQYLLIASGRNVLNRMQEFQGYNIAEAEADLSEAQLINRSNLDAVEELFAGDVWNYVNKLAQDTGQPYVKRYTDNPYRELYKLVTDFPELIWQQMRHLPGTTGVRTNQDEDGALRFLRAKVCNMTLAFSSWENFYRICEKSVLESRLTANAPNELRLKFSYDDLLKEKLDGVSMMDQVFAMFSGTHPEGKRYQHVCSLRDFFRNNQVYWMTLEFNQNVGGGSTTAPLSDELDLSDSLR